MQVQWDAQHIYVAFTVYDSYLSAPDTTAHFETDDAIELYISTTAAPEQRQDHLTDREYQFLVNALNRVTTIRGFAEQQDTLYGNRNFNWHATIASQVSRQGTLNDHQDVDTSLVYELAIPWSILDYRPTPGDTLFVNGAMSDADPQMKRTQYDWAGIRIYSHANQWYPMILSNHAQAVISQPEASGYSRWWVVWLLVLLLSGTALFWYIRQRQHPLAPVAIPQEAKEPIAPLRSKIHYTPTKVSKKVTSSEKIEQALDIIRHRYQQPLKLADLALEVGISERSLQAGLKRRTGNTFKSLIIEIRLEEGARLLKTTATPIAEICYQLGFSDVSNFRRSFKKKFHTTPRTYRKHHQNASS